MGDPLADVAQWITNAVYAFGYVGVFVLTFLGNLHLPVPTQLTLPLSGYLVWEGRFSFIPVMVASTTAAVAVSFVFYFLGACVSEESLHRLVGRYGRFVLVRESDLDKAGREFERHGGEAILIGHLVPGIGAFISIPAGIKRMPIRWRFLFYTILGSILYNVAHVGLGWALGSQWRLVERYEPILKYMVLATLAGGLSGLSGAGGRSAANEEKPDVKVPQKSIGHELQLAPTAWSRLCTIAPVRCTLTSPALLEQSSSSSAGGLKALTL